MMIPLQQMQASAQLRVVEEYLNRIKSNPTPGDMLGLTSMQSASGFFTFLTFDEWARLPWPNIGGPEGKQLDEGLTLGAYVSWFSHFLQCVCHYSIENRKPPGVFRLNGGTVGDTLLEVRHKPERRYENIIVSMAPLILYPGSFYTACLACGLYTRTGKYLGGAVGWNTGTTSPAVTYNELMAWAEYWGAEEMHIMFDQASPSILDISKLPTLMPEKSQDGSAVSRKAPPRIYQ